MKQKEFIHTLSKHFDVFPLPVVEDITSLLDPGGIAWDLVWEQKYYHVNATGYRDGVVELYFEDLLSRKKNNSWEGVAEYGHIPQEFIELFSLLTKKPRKWVSLENRCI